MWIEPNGQVKILQNVPIDNDYTHTLYFADRNAQYNYFSSKTKYTYPKITYQRVKRNKMRVEINAENLYDCNYLMFQNTSFGNRWFYAFIIKTEYVANNVTEITYVIDVMQTWFWDCELRDSFIEREHSVHDYLYENFVDEQLETGPYENGEYELPSDEYGIPLMQEMVIVVGCTFANEEGTLDSPFEEWGVTNTNGLVSSLCYYIFASTWQDSPDGTPGLEKLNHFIDEATRDNKSEGIVTMYMMPKIFATNTVTEPFAPANFFNYEREVNVEYNGSYKVRNKKLLTYPYRMLHVTDFHGQEADYRYEMFANMPLVRFRYIMGMSPEPSLLAVPVDYMNNPTNWNELMVSKCYPNVGFSIDGFKMWLAQNWGSLITAEVGAIGGIMGAGLSVPSVADVTQQVGYSPTSVLTEQAMNVSASNPTSLVGSLGIAFGTMMQIWQHTTMPSYAKNNPTADAQWIAGLRGIGFCDIHINYDYARRIDKFFDMFGYATRTVKIPNISSRPHWNYIKTGYLNIVGSIPADDLSLIQKIFMNGITFWKNGNEVGNYSLDNTPQ